MRWRTDLVGQEHAAAVEGLATLTGATFDQVYAKHMVSDRQKTVALFKQEASGNNDTELEAFASKALPAIDADGDATLT
jgi:predicted outer membrane protein